MKAELLADLFFKTIHGMGVFFDEIPFVYHDDDALSGFVSQTGDLFILFCDPFFRIDHDDAYVASLDSGDGAYDAEALDIFCHLCSSADSRRIDQRIFLTFMLKRRIYGISRGSGDIAETMTRSSPIIAVDER